MTETEGLPKRVYVLLCVVDEAIEEVVAMWVRAALPEDLVADVGCVRSLDEIMRVASKIRFDLAVLLLNNVIVPVDVNLMASALAGVKFLAELGIPVIASCGWDDSRKVDKRALEAGASFFFWLPIERQSFKASVRKCLGLPAE
jgi:hypothetical protein